VDTVEGAARDVVAPALIVRVMETHAGDLASVPVESMLGACPAVRLAAVRSVLAKKRERGKADQGSDQDRGMDVEGVAPEASFDSGMSTDDEALTDVDDLLDILL
jgi:hypothetical protein